MKYCLFLRLSTEGLNTAQQDNNQLSPQFAKIIC